MIYIVKTLSTPEFIKIGYSKNGPHRRIKGLQTGCPHKIELVSLWKGDFIHEGILHGHLSAFRAQGEWFIYTDECKEKLEAVIHMYGFKRSMNYRSDPRPRKSKVNKQLTERIMFFINKGETIREVANKLGIHKDTVMRHKNLYPAREDARGASRKLPKTSISTPNLGIPISV